MASSLCLGSIAEARNVDMAHAKKLLDRYLAVGHPWIGAWCLRLPYTPAWDPWMAVQYHRPDLDEGMLSVSRQAI